MGERQQELSVQRDNVSELIRRIREKEFTILTNGIANSARHQKTGICAWAGAYGIPTPVVSLWGDMCGR